MQEKLRPLQLTQLEILKVIDTVCKKYDIKYSLYAGSLLGAVRHKGFIPWDDDLDICMSRKDYDFFIKAWQNENPEGYLLENKDIVQGYTQSFTKIRKVHSTFWQLGEPTDKYNIGVFVDIFPIDRIPNGKFKRLVFQFRCLLYQLFTREYIPKKGNVLEKVISVLFLKTTPKSKYKSKRKKLYKKIVKYNKDKSLNNIAIEIFSTIRTPLPVNLTDEFVYLPFEDGQFMCFKEWEKYLTLKFGDYMKLPPEEDRAWRHKPVILNFDKSFDELMRGTEDKGKISILMGAYNCADTIKEAIASIQNQTYENWELIICDDASSDDTYKIVEEMQKTEPRIILIKNDENMGLNYTLNNCLSKATGEFIARMDGDDLCQSNRFEKQINFLTAQSVYDITGTAMSYFDDSGEWGRNNVRENPTPENVVCGTAICHATVMMRKKCMDDVNGYTVDKRMLRVEDVNLWIKLYEKGYRCHNFNETLYQMRNDKNAFNRRKFKYRINSTYVRLQGCKMLKLGLKCRLKAFIPMIKGLVPSGLRQKLRKKKTAN